MKPYYENNPTKYKTVVILPVTSGLYKLCVSYTGRNQNKEALFSIPDMVLKRNEGRHFSTAVQMLLNQATKQTGKEYKGGGGGYKFVRNDGRNELWASNAQTYRVYVLDGLLYIQRLANDNAGMLLRVRKLVGDAVDEEKFWSEKYRERKPLSERMKILIDRFRDYYSRVRGWH